MIKSFFSTLIFLTSIVCVNGWLSMRRQAQPIAPSSDATVEVISDIQANVGERSFWDDIVLPSSKLDVTIFLARGGSTSAADSEPDILAIVPELNSTYEYRTCEPRVLKVRKQESWVTWSGSWASVSPNKVDARTYMSQQITKFSALISRSKRIDRTLTISRDPKRLFHPDPEFQGRRIAQIEVAAKALVDKPFRMRIGDFSESTDQIQAIVPSIGQMVTFTVIRSCSKGDSVEVGKEHPLSAVRSSLRNKLEANSTAVRVQ